MLREYELHLRLYLYLLLYPPEGRRVAHALDTGHYRRIVRQAGKRNTQAPSGNKLKGLFLCLPDHNNEHNKQC